MRKHFAALGVSRSAIEPFYRVLQLFFLDDNVLGDASRLPWELELARLLAPLTTTLTAGTALVSLFREKFQLIRLRFMRGHVVICGLGHTGLQLANEFGRSGEHVVAIEIDNTIAAVEECRDQGMRVLIGDATEPRLLSKARVERARYLIAVCGEDGTNIETALQAQRLLRSRRKPGANHSASDQGLECFVQVVNSELRSLVKQSGLSIGTVDTASINFFNTSDNAARALLKECPPDYHDDPAANAAPHVIIIGFGDMGESLLLQAARVGHYAKGEKLKVTVIDKEAARKEKGCRLRYPQFDQICDASFLSLDIEDRDFITGGFLAAEDSALHLTSIYVCQEDDARALRCSLALLSVIENRRVQIAVCMRHEGGIASLLQTLNKVRDGQQLKVFQTIEFACAREIVLNARQDIVAKAIHRTYMDQHRVGMRGLKKKDYAVEWNYLPEEIKDSNRQQADHIPVKLRAIGCCAEPTGDPRGQAFQFTSEEVEILARMEHARWKAERLLSGWVHAPTDDAQKRHSPYLIAWDELPAEAQEYNRQSVRDIPAFLAQIGLGIRRKLNPPTRFGETGSNPDQAITAIDRV